MMKYVYVLVFLFVGLSLHAQGDRYLEYVFDESDIEVTQNVVYGQNFTALPAVAGMRTQRQPLIMDVYAPSDDSVTDRPVIIYLHTGNFFPVGDNGGVNGTLRDSSTVFACKRLARLGYVVASADYRLGWLPTHPVQDVRNFSLINAAYRGVQDARTCVRFFRRSAAEDGNPYAIDPDKVVVWGQGTGGYISTNVAALDNASEVVSTTMPAGKFVVTDGEGNPIPMVVESINGNLDGTSLGIAPEGYTWPPAGDTLCVSNHDGYSSEISMFVNMGGALGDVAWIDENTPPGVLFHVPSDLLAPYDSRVLGVPTATGTLPVVEVQGSYIAAKRMNELGINDVFMDVDDEYTDAARAASARAVNIQAPTQETANGHAYQEGLFPLNTRISTTPVGNITRPFVDSSPWDFWDADTWDAVPSPAVPGLSYHEVALLDNPAMSKEKSLAYIDTCVLYFAPRALRALGLRTTASVANVSSSAVGLMMSPNPVSNLSIITTDTEHPFRAISVYQLDGKEVFRQNGLSSNSFELRTDQLPTGMYVLQLLVDKGVVSKKFVVQK